MPVFATFEDRAYFNPNIMVLGIWNNEYISSVYVLNCSKNGIITIEAIEDTPIKPFVQFVADIFHPESNFVSTVCDLYKVSTDNFKAIKFEFNGAQLIVSKTNANAQKIYNEWERQIKKIRKEYGD